MGCDRELVGFQRLFASGYLPENGTAFKRVARSVPFLGRHLSRPISPFSLSVPKKEANRLHFWFDDNLVERSDGSFQRLAIVITASNSTFEAPTAGPSTSISHYATLALNASGLMLPRYESRLRAL